MQFVLFVLSQIIPRLFSRTLWLRWLGVGVPLLVMVAVMLQFATAWAPLPFTQDSLGLYAPTGIGLATFVGFWLGRNQHKATAAPFEEQTLKSARKAEKAKVERDLATDRAAALEAKIATLEMALQKALSAGRGPTP